jgi:hypothetical protein
MNISMIHVKELNSQPESAPISVGRPSDGPLSTAALSLAVENAGNAGCDGWAEKGSLPEENTCPSKRSAKVKSSSSESHKKGAGTVVWVFLVVPGRVVMGGWVNRSISTSKYIRGIFAFCNGVGSCRI